MVRLFLVKSKEKSHRKKIAATIFSKQSHRNFDSKIWLCDIITYPYRCPCHRIVVDSCFSRFVVISSPKGGTRLHYSSKGVRQASYWDILGESFHATKSHKDSFLAPTSALVLQFKKLKLAVHELL